MLHAPGMRRGLSQLEVRCVYPSWKCGAFVSAGSAVFVSDERVGAFVLTERAARLVRMKERRVCLSWKCGVLVSLENSVPCRTAAAQVGQGVLQLGQAADQQRQEQQGGVVGQQPTVVAPKAQRRGLGLWRGLWGLGARHKAAREQQPQPPGCTEATQAGGLSASMHACPSPVSQDEQKVGPLAVGPPCSPGDNRERAHSGPFGCGGATLHAMEGSGVGQAGVVCEDRGQASASDREGGSSSVCGGGPLAGRKRPSDSIDLGPWEQGPSLRRSLNSGGCLPLHAAAAGGGWPKQSPPSASAPQLRLELPPDLATAHAHASLQANLLNPRRSHNALTHPQPSSSAAAAAAAFPLSPLPSVPLTNAPCPPAPHTFSPSLTHPHMAILEGVERNSSGGRASGSSLGDAPTLLSAFGSDQGRSSSMLGSVQGRVSQGSMAAAAAAQHALGRGADAWEAAGVLVGDELQEPQHGGLASDAASASQGGATQQQRQQHALGAGVWAGDPQAYLHERAMLWNRTALQVRGDHADDEGLSWYARRVSCALSDSHTCRARRVRALVLQGCRGASVGRVWIDRPGGASASCVMGDCAGSAGDLGGPAALCEDQGSWSFAQAVPPQRNCWWGAPHAGCCQLPCWLRPLSPI